MVPYQVESKLRTQKKATKQRDRFKTTCSEKEYVVKIASSMIKMSNFLAKNVIMTALTQGKDSLMLSRSEIGSHEFHYYKQYKQRYII